MIQGVAQQLSFDYGSLDEPTRAFVQEKAQRIHARLKRTAEDIIAIGQDLIGVQERLSYGSFQSWLAIEFDMTYRTALNFIRVAKRFAGRSEIISLPVTILYELAAPSTTEPVIQMVTTGQIPATIPAIREAKQQIVQPLKYEPDQAGPKGYEFWKAEREETEEDRYQTAVDMGTTDLYYDGLRRAAIQHDKEERRVDHALRVMTSSESPEWYTPHEIIDLVCSCLERIDLDPCSNSHEKPVVPARTLYTREDNGLIQQWFGRVYMNPPYGSEVNDWVQALVTFYEQGDVEEAIALLPARIDTLWFQPLYAYPMCHIRGRLQFENAQYSAPFPSILVYLGQRKDRFIAHFKDLGPIMGRIG